MCVFVSVRACMCVFMHVNIKKGGGGGELLLEA